ncbi:MAG: response regulator [Salinibacter sp.]|uniref:hybrid sensor histidine kinase/response regulator transcription factor n=1 Tax=Salinibacter sp. TaxID=2065818 RepID=UPI0035D409E4
MERTNFLERARRVFLKPSAFEADRAFRVTLAQLACTGLQWGGALGLVGLLILIPVNTVLLGRPVAWWYTSPSASPEAFVLWDEAVGTLLCGAAVWIGWTRCRLSVARMAGGAIAAVVAVVALISDAYRGMLAIEYLILIYLLAVATIPYRPWQALLLGGVLMALLAGIGHYGLPGTAASQPGLVTPGHLVRMGFVIVVVTGISALLYSIRYRQHHARREAERLHKQVADLERAKSRFFADVSHEFRTPLTLILGTLREALEGRLGSLSPQLHDRMETLDAQARRMRRLVNQLLELAQLDEGRLALSVQPCVLGALVRRITVPFRDWAETEGHSFQTEMEDDGLEVWADPDRLEAILANLLSNAIKYTPEGGTIRVRLHRRDGHAAIAVRDTGPGLPDAIRTRVFERHESAVPAGGEPSPEASATSEEDSWVGMGIGLAHTKALVERHGGQLEVESEEGFGTEFTVLLPLGDEHVAEGDQADPTSATASDDRTVDLAPWTEAQARVPADEVPADEPTAADEEAPEVLVVDDEAEIRGYLQNLLGTQYRVRTASDAEEGLSRLHDRPPDLVISDVVMPERDGIDLCRAIREDEQLRPLPVILLTARQEDRLSGLQAGADAYVSKPFDPAELEARVENLIEIRQIVQDRVQVPDWMEPKEASISSEEANFLEQLNEAVNAHIDNSNFGVDWLADEMDLSARHLRRRIKDTTGLSASGFIRTRRLQHAASLLEEGADTISDVAGAVGYRDPSYFSRLFRETFGCSPTEYAEQEAERPDNPDLTS